MLNGTSLIVATNAVENKMFDGYIELLRPAEKHFREAFVG